MSHDEYGLRQPPWAIEAEQAVLGGIMIAPPALLKVIDMLAPEDFYRRDHQLIYRAILDMAEKDKPFDSVTMGEWFELEGMAKQVAGGAYLNELAITTPSAANIVAYAEIVRDRSTLRKLIQVGTKIVNDGFEPGHREAREVVADGAARLSALAGNAAIGGAETMRNIAGMWFEQLKCRSEKPTESMGILTPWTSLNKMLAGLQPADLVILAGRPSMGKSALAINIAAAASLAGKRGLYFSLEMTSAAIFNRCVAALGNIPLSWLKKPAEEEQSELYWARVGDAVKQLRAAPLMIDETPATTHEAITARARREHMREPLSFIVIDHMHLMPLPGKTKEATEVGHITASLKKLAKDLKIPVIALAQLNRGLESRTNKRPTMADLRESGAIEQDADIILLVYRDDYYANAEGRASTAPGVVELIVAKQREGETGAVYLSNRLGMGRVDDVDEGWQPAAAPKAKATWNVR